MLMCQKSSIFFLLTSLEFVKEKESGLIYKQCASSTLLFCYGYFDITAVKEMGYIILLGKCLI